MGQGTIAQAQKGSSPIEGILNALQAVHQFYGIDTEKAQQKLLGTEQAQKELALKSSQETSDPNSPISKFAQQAEGAGMQALRKNGVIPKDAALPSTEGMSADQLKQLNEVSPLYKLATAKMGADARGVGFQFRDDQLKERQDFTAHQKNLQKLKGDHELGQMVTNYNNLQGTLSNLDRMGSATKQDYEDLQNTVISNMGVKGQGGVAERSKRYAESLGMNADALQQFLTGKPQDVSQGNPLFDRYKEVAQMELGNYQKRIGAKVNALTSGNRSIYERRPDLKGDLADAVQMTTGQLNALGSQADAPRTAAPTGNPDISAQAAPKMDLQSLATAELARRQKKTVAGGPNAGTAPN